MSWQCDGCGVANIECYKAGSCTVYSPIMLKAIDVLWKQYNHPHAPRDLQCSWLGEKLWPDRAGNGTAPMARSAGALMARMLKLGLVQRSSDKYRTYWRLTKKGREIAEHRQ